MSPSFQDSYSQLTISLSCFQFAGLYSMVPLIFLSLLLWTPQSAEPKLEKHVIPLYGNATLGYYYANIYVGTPPQEQSVIIDTGSGHLALPCSECKNCGPKHIHPPFNLKKSGSCKILTCNSQEELCVSSCHRKDATEACTFSINYAEGSSLSGIILEDEIQFQSDSVGESIKTAFGCTTRETNLFFTQQANGIFGLAPERQAKLLDLLYEKHSVVTGEKLMFSLCLAKNGGQFVVGQPKQDLHKQGEASVKIRFNPGRNLYSLEGVGDIRMGENVIHSKGDFAGVYGFFIDSGSTFTYLPRSNFKSLEIALENACSLVPDKCLVAKGRASCYKITHRSDQTIKERLREIFPDLEIEINGEVIRWNPSHYFLLKSLTNGQVCLGIEPLDRFILGANWMVDRDIIFDIRGQTVEIFSNSSCSPYPPADIPSTVKVNEELPVYSGDSKPEKLSYIQAVFRMDSNFTIFLVALILVIICLMTLLIIIGKMANRKKKGFKEAHGEQIERIKEREVSDRKAIQHLSRQVNEITRQSVVVLSPDSLAGENESSNRM